MTQFLQRCRVCFCCFMSFTSRRGRVSDLMELEGEKRQKRDGSNRKDTFTMSFLQLKVGKNIGPQKNGSFIERIEAGTAPSFSYFSGLVIWIAYSHHGSPERSRWLSRRPPFQIKCHVASIFRSERTILFKMLKID